MRTILLFTLGSSIIWGSIEHAKVLYNNKEYTKAIKEAKQSKKDYSNPRLHLI